MKVQGLLFPLQVLKLANYPVEVFNRMFVSAFRSIFCLAFRLFQICPEMHANEIHAPYDRHHKVSPSPNPHHKATNSAKHEDIWKLQLIVCNMNYPSPQLRAFLNISGLLGVRSSIT